VSKSSTNLILDDGIHQRIQKSGILHAGLTDRPHLFNADTLSGLQCSTSWPVGYRCQQRI